MSNKFERLNSVVSRGALDIVDESITKDKNEEKTIKVVKEEKRYLRSYTLTESQIKMLQAKKLSEIGVSMSDIVGKAIEMYCKE